MGKPNLSSPDPRRLTAVFAKQPEPGRVKTRLCPPLEPSQAAQLAQAMLGDLVEHLVPANGFKTTICYAPTEAKAWFAESFPEIRDQREQVGAGLGERMLHFFEIELTGTVGSTAVAVGCDAPLISPAVIAEAHDRLQAGADLVLGPDAGGGYYLIGMKVPHTQLFEGVEMSTSEMFENTVEVAKTLGLKIELLELLYDIDDASDLKRLRGDLDRLTPSNVLFPRRTADCLNKLPTDQA